MSYKDLLGPDGSQNNMGGTKQWLYFASVIQDLLPITGIKMPVAADAETDDKYVVKTPHVCKTGKKFTAIYCTVNTSELTAAMNGQTDGRSVALTLTFKHPGTKKEVIKFMNEAKNDRFVFLVPLPDGTIIQLGTPDFFAYVSHSLATGTTTGDGKSTTFTVECWMPDIIIYDAAVPLTPAV